MICKRASQVMGLGLGPFEDKEAGLVQSMRAKVKIAEKHLKLEFGKASRLGFTGWGCAPHFVV